MDIRKAIEIEKHYLECRIKGEHPYHLAEKIRKCGFTKLEDYYEKKKNYLFSQLNFEYIETTQEKCLKDVFKAIEERKTCFLFADTEKTFVFNGTAKLNKDYCNKYDIPVYPIETRGGTIISSVGDLSLGICCPKSIGIDRKYILNEIKDILQRYTKLSVTVNGNDILVDGKKVIGSSSYSKNEVFMFVCHISFNDNKKLISNICITSKVSKEVGYIDFMTNKQFRQEVSKWLQT